MRTLILALVSTLAACASTSANCPDAHTAGNGVATADSVAYAPTGPDGAVAPASITVTSEAFAEGAAMPTRTVFNSFGCTGDNRSPALAWRGAPEGTRSFAVVVHDPDAPTGTGFYHWAAFDLPAGTTALAEGAGAEGALPAGAHTGRTDFGGTTYGGPCPPPGPAHRYRFTVYALDTASLGLPDGASPAVVRFSMRGHILAHGTLTGTWGR